MNRKHVSGFALFLAITTLTTLIQAQENGAAKTILRPPADSSMALVVFEDLQCPACARAQLALEEAVKTYKLPLVVYDFPLPMHPWAQEASVWAHYFRSKSTKTNNLEAAFRKYIYLNQPAITPENLRSYAAKFAQERHVEVPFILDSQGKLAAEVAQDKNKGNEMKIQQTPTVYIVTNKVSGTPYVEVADGNQLFAMIDDLQAK